MVKRDKGSRILRLFFFQSFFIFFHLFSSFFIYFCLLFFFSLIWFVLLIFFFFSPQPCYHPPPHPSARGWKGPQTPPPRLPLAGETEGCPLNPRGVRGPDRPFAPPAPEGWEGPDRPFSAGRVLSQPSRGGRARPIVFRRMPTADRGAGAIEPAPLLLELPLAEGGLAGATVSMMCV